jgi:2-polyprenyl-3-methyl-5-hydroxy-6-metoxy-1,4-benzoquinol methylase
MNTARSFSGIGFEEFKKLALDTTLSKYEKIGFPDSYRSTHEKAIFEDILKKCDRLLVPNVKVWDIGAGCSDLPMMLIEHCANHGSNVVMVDSQEMLDFLPHKSHVEKLACMFPHCAHELARDNEKVDVIICYSVIQYALVDTSFIRFFDSALKLLAPKGQFLIGDIPNVSKRKRFFSSDTGKTFHKKFMNTTADPEVDFHTVEYDQFDDALVFALLQRARLAGFDSYILPQPMHLALANRREDILITRP